MPTQTQMQAKALKVVKKAKAPIKRIIKLKVVEPVAVQAPLGATAKQYLSLQEAFTYYNKALFNNELPEVLVTFQRQKKSYGYYWPDKLVSRVDGSKMAEIALAINTFDERTDNQIFSTLVHEMVHHWQQVKGKPSRNGYHNAEWAAKMKEVGLYPSDTAQVGGKETGQSVSHYILEHGTFAHHTVNLVASIDWNSAPDDEKKKAKSNKVKYSCPECDANAWGKPDLHIMCGEHECDMIAE